MELTLTPAERRKLKARAHHLDPVVLVGDAGLTPAVLQEIEVHLKSHELIKVKMAAEREERETAAAHMAAELNAAIVQHIGKTLVVYRPHPPEEVAAAAAKRKPRRKQPRRTKRSYQMS